MSLSLVLLRGLYGKPRVANGFTCGGRTPARTLTGRNAMLRPLTRHCVASADVLIRWT